MRSAPKSALQALREVPLFDRCTDKELRALANLGTAIELPEGESLTRPGQRGQEFFILLSGKARCTVDGHEMAIFGPGDFFGEMSLLDGKPRSAEVVTMSEVEALVLDRREFLRFVETSPAIA
ncbi:MAG: cyclic nucleotide-binding domain-containing protein, partial [Acidimicrobiales bacterium]